MLIHPMEPTEENLSLQVLRFDGVHDRPFYV